MHVSNTTRRLLFCLACLTASCATSSEGKQPPGPEEVVEEATETPDLAALREVPDGFQTAEVLHVMPTSQGYAVLLGDGTGDRVVPIFVGETEAMAIHLRKERRRYERPLTHDLLDDMLRELDAEVVKVHIDGLKTGVFVGTVFVATDAEVLQFDSRSSDAIAIALGNEVPIFIADEVVDAAGISREEIERAPPPPPESPPPATTEEL